MNYESSQNLELDIWYRFVNFIMISLSNSQILTKFPRYELIEYVFTKIKKRVDIKDIFEIYYRYVDRTNEVICHEDDFLPLSEDQKKNIAFVVLKNKKIRVLANKFIFIPVSNYRGFFNSFIVANFKYNGTYPIPKNYLDLIKTKEPLFSFFDC